MYSPTVLHSRTSFSVDDVCKIIIVLRDNEADPPPVRLCVIPPDDERSCGELTVMVC